MTDNRRKKKKGSKKSRKKRIEPGSVSKTDAISTNEDSDKKKAEQLAVKKAPEVKTRKKSSGTNFISVSIQFLKDAKTELKKVKWPTKKELMAATLMVIVLALIVALYLGVVDFGLIKLLEYIL
ncbi:preprotein translocase subunit SecE [Thermodesulfobacteriota bacterium]